MFSAKLLATTIALFTFASASPVLQARSCRPKFDGALLTIFKTGDLEWQPTNAIGGDIKLAYTSTPFSASEFLVANSGQPEDSYVFKFVPEPSPRAYFVLNIIFLK